MIAGIKNRTFADEFPWLLHTNISGLSYETE